MLNIGTLGNWFLHFACFLSFYAALVSLFGGKLARRNMITSARNSLWMSSGIVFTCAVLLVVALVRGDFHLQYVFEYTNSTMPLSYKIAALWGGQNGSLLWWLTILSVYTSVALFKHRKDNQHLEYNDMKI